MQAREGAQAAVVPAEARCGEGIAACGGGSIAAAGGGGGWWGSGASSRGVKGSGVGG